MLDRILPFNSVASVYWKTLTNSSTDEFAVLPWLGVLALFIGIVWAIFNWERRYLWFPVPLILSEAVIKFVLYAGDFGVGWKANAGWVSGVYFYAQIIILIRIVHILHWQGKGAHMPGLFMAFFVGVYARISANLLNVALVYSNFGS